jgi:hypothetical protein
MHAYETIFQISVIKGIHTCDGSDGSGDSMDAWVKHKSNIPVAAPGCHHLVPPELSFVLQAMPFIPQQIKLK